LSKEGADWVAAHLVAAGALAADEPETAWRHARAARARGGRIGVVRETVGLVAYRAGEWAEAIGELRAARRMGGGPGHLAVMADCERALEHPERAIELSRSAEADDLDDEASAELSIVVAGARADLGQIDAALAHLERIGLDKAEERPRLAYAYADLLLKADRGQEALSWFIRSANADTDEETDALERVAALTDEAELGAAELLGPEQGGPEQGGAELGGPEQGGPGPTEAESTAETLSGEAPDDEESFAIDSEPASVSAASDGPDSGPEDVVVSSPEPMSMTGTEEDSLPLLDESLPLLDESGSNSDGIPGRLFSDDARTGDQ